MSGKNSQVTTNRVIEFSEKAFLSPSRGNDTP